MSLKSRDQMKEETEKEILNYLRSQPKHVSFYKLYTDLNYTSGKAQTAIRRLQADGRLYVKKKISKFQTFVYDRDFEIEPKIIKNLDEDIMVFPFNLPYWLGVILKQIPKISDDYTSFMEIVEKSLISFFQEKLPFELKRKAILQAAEKGKIPESLVKKLIGDN